LTAKEDIFIASGGKRLQRVQVPEFLL